MPEEPSTTHISISLTLFLFLSVALVFIPPSICASVYLAVSLSTLHSVSPEILDHSDQIVTNCESCFTFYISTFTAKENILQADELSDVVL